MTRFFKDLLQKINENDFINRRLTFDNPHELLLFLTSKDKNYAEVLDVVQGLFPQISELHTNANGKEFRAITQCILECIKRIKSYKDTRWVSDKMLVGGLKSGETPFIFSRVCKDGTFCEYKIYNFDQLDTSKSVQIASKDLDKKVKRFGGNKSAISKDNLIIDEIVRLIDLKHNLFITGHAGTGKSYILEQLKNKYGNRLVITSTTGIAAVNVKGQTIHSWANVGICNKPLEVTVRKIMGKQSVKRQIQKCKLLAIDEISMLNAQTFEYVDAVLKMVRNSEKPFGGIQVIFIGDFFQLPPVENENNDEFLYCFESSLWQKFNFKNVLLTKNYRQNEELFIKALSNMRMNKMTYDDIALLKRRIVVNKPKEEEMLHIFSTNSEANIFNAYNFDKLKAPIHEFFAKDGVCRGRDIIYENFSEYENMLLEILDKNCRVERNIRLKQGCRVMLVLNLDFENGLINGSCGEIIHLEESNITIKFDNGVTRRITPEKFEYFYNNQLMAVRLQYPLKLAYAITIHKSQGMTLDKLFVDCKRIFEKGQAYVAMSRVRTLDGLYLQNFSENKVYTDEKVVAFYNSLKFEELEKELNARTVANKFVSKENIVLNCIKSFDGRFEKKEIIDCY